MSGAAVHESSPSGADRESVEALIQAVKHDGEIRAIDAGRPAAEWRNYLSPVLRLALDRVTGEG